jgi:Na+/H+ antiporter NhaB
MFSSIIATISSVATAIYGVVVSVVTFFNKKTDIETGKKIQKAEDIIENQKISEEQNQILVQDRTKEEIIEKLKKGTF